VFVLAPARSFSSVVTQSLGCHPQLYAFPELLLSSFDTVDEWLDQDTPGPRIHENRTSGLVRAFAELRFGGQTEAGVAATWRYLESMRGRPARVLLDELLGAVAPAIAVEKSPEAAVVPGALSRLLRWYPEARFIHLLRHPVATCESQVKHWTVGEEWWRGDPHRWVPFGLISNRRRIIAFLNGMPTERWRPVRGEDVVDDPAGALEPVLAWLGLRTDAEALDALRHPERSPYACVGPVGAGGGNDPTFQASPTLRPARRSPSLALPSEWRVSRPWREELESLGRELGYA
jgi:Sulfotransferase family